MRNFFNFIRSAYWVYMYRYHMHKFQKLMEIYLHDQNDPRVAQLFTGHILLQIENIKLWLILYDPFVDFISNGITDLPNSATIVISSKLGVVVVNRAYHRANRTLQHAIIEHELGHLIEGHLSGMGSIKTNQISCLQDELAADRHVTDKQVLSDLLDLWLCNPKVEDRDGMIRARKNALQV